MPVTTAITEKPVDFKNTLSVAGADNKTGSEILAQVWDLDAQKTQQVSNVSKMYHSKHGMFASIPIICRGDDCHYKDTCAIDQCNRIVGSRCPMEIAAIITRFNQWCEHFNIDNSEEYIAPKDLVDATLIKDLVNIEVQILRAENKIALSGDFMAQTLIEIDKKGTPYYGTVITPEAEFLNTLQDKKIKILNQLNATRKDKANDKRKETASDEAVKIFQQVQNLQKDGKLSNQNQDIMDVEFDENGNIIEIVEETEEEIIDEPEQKEEE